MSLAHLEPRAAVAIPDVVVDHGVGLREELELWQEAFEFAKAIATTPFVPSGLKNQPAAVMACILRANELGISALHGLSQIHIIDGRPGLAAELMRALVLSKGHEIWTEEISNSRVVLCGRRASGEHVQKVTWTLDDAKTAKLEGKDNWRKYPRAMLLARASAELCRLMFADVLAGMSYATEELEDMADELPSVDDEPERALPPAGQTRKATRPTAKSKARTRKSAPPVKPTAGPPPLPGEEDDGVLPLETTAREEEPEELVVKRAQQIAIRANDADVDHHHVIEAVTNGQKVSAKAVTAAEASQVLDAINAIQMGELKLVDGAAGFRLEPADPADQQEFEWPGARWEQFIKEHRITKSALLKEAARWCKEHDEDAPTTLDGLRDRDVLCVHLHSWVQEQSS